jgi:hypothetical protein
LTRSGLHGNGFSESQPPPSVTNPCANPLFRVSSAGTKLMTNTSPPASIHCNGQKVRPQRAGKTLSVLLRQDTLLLPILEMPNLPTRGIIKPTRYQR